MTLQTILRSLAGLSSRPLVQGSTPTIEYQGQNFSTDAAQDLQQIKTQMKTLIRTWYVRGA